jgi:hypothetical protein
MTPPCPTRNQQVRDSQVRRQPKAVIELVWIHSMCRETVASLSWYEAQQRGCTFALRLGDLPSSDTAYKLRLTHL